MTETTTNTAPTMDTLTTTATTSTLYPKILGDIRTTIRNLEKHHRQHIITFPPAPLNPIRMTGTTKLHGTHADIRIHRPRARGRSVAVVPQSRNNPRLTPARDNFGFARFCADRHARILMLADAICRRWEELYQREDEDEDVMVLAGEWIGAGIQAKPLTAIRGLGRRFMLCGLRVRGVWEPVARYADVADEEAGLYNVSRGGVWHLELDVADGGKGFMEEARRLTEEVEKRCPFGAATGVEGPGEGIVWTPAEGADSVPNDPAFWIKTKVEDFEGRAARKNGKAAKPLDELEKEAAAKAFAERACHERRLEQGWYYLREVHVERDMKGMQMFLSWVAGDVEVEEKEDIAELKLGKRWRILMSRTAREWYLGQLKEHVDGNALD